MNLIRNAFLTIRLIKNEFSGYIIMTIMLLYISI